MIGGEKVGPWIEWDGDQDSTGGCDGEAGKDGVEIGGRMLLYNLRNATRQQKIGS